MIANYSIVCIAISRSLKYECIDVFVFMCCYNKFTQT